MACARPFLVRNRYFLSGSLNPSFRQKYIQVPCGWCLNCRVDNRNRLEDYCNYEFKKFGCGAFVTLTYDNYHINDKVYISDKGEITESVKYKDFQDFNKRLKRYIDYHNLDSKYINKKYKFVAVTEYGEKGSRPHIHALFFGLDYSIIKKLLYDNWQNGFVDVGAIKKGGIRYVLKYIDKQLHGEDLIKAYDDKGLERPRLRHSTSFGTGLIFDNLDVIKENNFCYQIKGNKWRPISPYYKNKIFGKSVSHSQVYAKDMKAHGLKPDVEALDGTKYYSLKAINNFRHSQALLREQNLINASRNHGIPCYVPYERFTNNYDVDLLITSNNLDIPF